MPIKPENRKRYPANWKEIRARILERDGHQCAWCGRLCEERPRQRERKTRTNLVQPVLLETEEDAAESV